MRKTVSLVIILTLLASSAALFWVSANSTVAQTSDPHIVRTSLSNDGRQIDKIVVPGKPPEIKAEAVDVLPSSTQTGVNILSDVPAFYWSYGCSATSAAMLFGYYDRTGYSNMYTGTTNGGVCPPDNSGWGSTAYPSVTCGECPLSATHQGLDGRTSRGSVDDYWIDYGNIGPDPYIVNGWTEHTQGDCTGDFMGTNQSKFSNPDGATTFYYYANGDPLYDFTGCEPNGRDGTHGLKLFAVSRGYSVVADFLQLIQGYPGTTSGKGFTFANYMSEIDAGRPVLIQVSGHTMLGYGYNTSGNIVYLHDTWDYSTHQMTWGGSYAGLQQIGVTVLQLASVPMAATPTVATNNATGIGTDSATLNMSYDFSTYSSGQVQFAYEPDGGSWTYTSWVAKSASGSYSEAISGLSSNTTYHFKARLKYNSTEIEGSVKDFTTAVVAIHHYSVSSISSSPTAGTPFSVTIQAQDASNNNINTGSETVNISFGKTDTLATPTSTSTTNGKATVNMTMTKAQTGQTITFTGATSGKSGTSGSFNVSAGAIHHYSVSSISSPQAAGTPFSVTIQAQDQYNNNINTGGETANISFGKTDTLAIPTSTSTTNGKVTVSMTMTVAQSGQSITFTGATSGKSGTSNSFTVNAAAIPSVPTLTSPTNGSTVSNQTPRLQWNASTGATSYGIQVSTSYRFTSLVINQTGITNTYYDVPSGKLGWNTTYYWRVNASNTGGTSSWSSYWQFKTPTKPQPPSAPSLLSPTNGSTVSTLSITLQWNASTRATSYGLQVSTSYQFTSLVINLTSISNTYYNVPSGVLKANTTYYWRVNATNANGTSSWSSYRQFKIASTAASRGWQMFGQENQGLPDVNTMLDSPRITPY